MAQEKGIKKKHCFWARDTFKKREELGIFYSQAQEMQLNDRENFFRYERFCFNFSPPKTSNFHFCCSRICNLNSKHPVSVNMYI